jgi:DNA polymerase III epsilon subunit-like protein
LCNSLDIEIESRHRAFGDAKATTILFEKLLAHGDEKLFLKPGTKIANKI